MVTHKIKPNKRLYAPKNAFQTPILRLLLLFFIGMGMGVALGSLKNPRTSGNLTEFDTSLPVVRDRTGQREGAGGVLSARLLRSREFSSWKERRRSCPRGLILSSRTSDGPAE
ncbi:hypothetical protein SERLA73DRAFT_138011 [Serpula lacrymans var. lacrymans S7.3]|uniref:Uncharacterized protein n=1 Tax=Serpula lacrymans var. lacrymans (strain S7.3) TaxID=936435 RepID=F8Q0P3_SERL3|nr:hypothetical protein SERLA73DRAFT_138011 [Serpula lacrymans var. lacrymans S7.3]